MKKGRSLVILGLVLIAAMACKKSTSPVQIEQPTEGNKPTTPPIAPKTKKVLFIGIDGLVWRTITTANAPALRALMDGSLTYTNALAETPTWSSNGWSALFTGVGVAKHKAIDNSFTGADFTSYPSFFRQIKTTMPKLRTASIVTWSSINKFIVADQDATIKTDSPNDNATEVSIIKEIRNNNGDVSFCHFDNVDHAGHASDFNPATKMYADSVKAVDVRVGKILQAIRSRSTYANEDWLIIVATDHGGDVSHGGSSYKERNAFIIINNAAIAPKLISQEPVETVQTKPLTINTISFNSNIYGSLPALAGLGLGSTNSFTIEFRVRATSVSSDPVIIGNKDWSSGFNKGIIISNRNGTIRANFGDGSNRLDVDGVDLSDQRWHQVAIVVDRGAQKAQIYDAGELIAEGNIAKVGDLQSGQAFKLGQDATNNYNPAFTGNISEIRIFNSALLATTIKNYAFAEITDAHPDRSGLKLYAKGNDGTGTIYQGSLSTPSIFIIAKNDVAITWGSLSTPIYLAKTADYFGAPYLYNVPPTILRFLGIPKPTYYDGNTLFNF